MGREWTHREWTEEEIEFLKENYGEMSPKEIGKELSRSPDSIREGARSLGLKEEGSIGGDGGTYRIDVKMHPSEGSRNIFLMANEAARIVQEGEAGAEDIDRVIEFNFGWERGPCKLADERGIDRIVERLEELHEELQDERYRPCSLLKDYAKEGRRFYE